MRHNKARPREEEGDTTASRAWDSSSNNMVGMGIRAAMVDSRGMGDSRVGIIRMIGGVGVGLGARGVWLLVVVFWRLVVVWICCFRAVFEGDGLGWEGKQSMPGEMGKEQIFSGEDEEERRDVTI